MQKFSVKDHEYSLLPEGKEWELIWSDEFDGDQLDTTKWGFRLNFWGKPFEGYTDQGIILDGKSHIELHRVERNGYYVSPQLQTGSNSFDIPKGNQFHPVTSNTFWPLGNLEPAKFIHRFGFYECRCKFQKDPETMWSAFWTQSPSIGASYDPAWCGVESDIMEYPHVGRISTGNIMGGYGNQFRDEGRVWYPMQDTEDGFHRFGMLWTPTEYVFYYNGEIVSRANKDVSQIPQFILLTTEVKGWRKNVPIPVGDHFEDDAFIVDYVRVFDEKK